MKEVYKRSSSELRFSQDFQDSRDLGNQICTTSLRATTRNPIGIMLALFLVFLLGNAAGAYAQVCDTIKGVSITTPTTTVVRQMSYAGTWKTPADSTIVFTAGIAEGSDPVYEWYVDGRLQIDSTRSAFVFVTPKVEGIYNVYAAARNECTESNTVRSVKIAVIVTKVLTPEPPKPPEPSGRNPWVGTFHRADETGERIIYYGHTGAWKAEVVDSATSAGNFIVLDGGGAGITDRLIDMFVNGNPGNPEDYQLSPGSLHSVSGTGNILLRVGLTDKLASADTPPRYGKIKITTSAGGNSYIYVRQGEEADNVSEDTGHKDVKWSPYNVGNYHNPSQYGYDKLVDYPTKAGYFYPWGYNTVIDTARAYPPQDPTNFQSGAYYDAKYSLTFVCPSNYIVPSGNTTGEIASIVYNASTNSSISYANGYYADGYFDRRVIGTAFPSNSPNQSAVSTKNNDVAYCGRLVYNSTTNASLFFPYAGERRQGYELYALGVNGYYWSRTPASSRDGANLTIIGAGTLNNSNRDFGYSVRCVYNPCTSIGEATLSSTGVLSGATGSTPATLTADVTPSGATTPLSYQWERMSNGIDWDDVEGATSPSLLAKAVVVGVTKYRVTVSNACSSVVSDTIEIVGTETEPVPVLPVFVGAFWKNDQQGERLIHIERAMASPADAADGAWRATVMAGNDWIILDTEDSNDAANLGWLGGDESGVANMLTNDASYLVSGNATSVSGEMDNSIPRIYFRIGLTSANPTPGTPRYGMVLLTYGNHQYSQRIFIRQGEDADNVSTNAPHDAVKWSPYNVGNVNDIMNYPDSLVDYPTKAGFIYQWSHGSTDPTTPWPYHPQEPMGSPTWENSGLVTSASFIGVCPTGYRIPTGNIDQTGETESLAPTGTGTNSVWGYYADGYFDRRMIDPTAEGNLPGSNAVVSKGNDDVAYLGRLFYNSTTNASLFLPAAGCRNMNIGELYSAGAVGFFWSRTASDNNEAYYLGFESNISNIFHELPHRKSQGFSIRCIAEPPSPCITQDDPQDITICPGSTTINLAVATGGTGSITYQWEQSSDNITWTTADGTNNTQNYITPNLSYDTVMYYRRKASCDCGDVTSAAALVTVPPLLRPLPVFMDYNLGADPQYDTPKKQMEYLATSHTGDPLDAKVYGGLYQWGRKNLPYAVSTDGSYLRYSGGSIFSGYINATQHVASLQGHAIPPTYDSDGQIATINGVNADDYHIYSGPPPNDWRGASPDGTTSFDCDVNFKCDTLWGNGVSIDTPTDPEGWPWNGHYYQKPHKTINDPCPSGFRVPTQDDWERLSNYCDPSAPGGWFSHSGIYNTTTGLTWVAVRCGDGSCVPSTYWFGSISGGYAIYETSVWENASSDYKDGTLSLHEAAAPSAFLFLPAAGCRIGNSGGLADAGRYGYYWSSSVEVSYSYFLRFYTDPYIRVEPQTTYNRASGYSVRCVKE